MVYAPPRDGYAVFCQREVTPAVDLGEAARRLAEAYRKGWECRVMACPTVHRQRDLHDWERKQLIELATSLLVAAT